MPKASIGDDPARPAALADGVGFIIPSLVGLIYGGVRKDIIQGVLAGLGVFLVYLLLFLYRGRIKRKLERAIEVETEQAIIEINSLMYSPERIPLDVLPRILNAKHKEMRMTTIQNNPGHRNT